jgi:hypothetical protein
VAGAGDDVHVAVAELFGRLADAGDERRIEGDRIEMADGLDAQPTPSAAADFGAFASIAGAHAVELGLLGRADVDGEDHVPGRTLRELGENFTWPTPPTAPGCSLHRHFLHHFEDAGHGEAGIDAHVHRRRAGMGFLAGQGEFQPPEALAVGDDADLLVLGLEDRALLDVIFEIGVHLAAPTSSSPTQPMRFSSSPKLLPSMVLAAIGVVERVTPAKTPEASMAGAKRAPSSLVQLVTTIGCLVLMPRSFSCGRLRARQHAEHAVIFAAGRLGIEMAADIDRHRDRVGAGGGSNMVPIWSTPMVRPASSHQRWKRRRPFGVVVGQGLAVVAAGNAGADLRHLHEHVPEPIAEGC